MSHLSHTTSCCKHLQGTGMARCLTNHLLQAGISTSPSSTSRHRGHASSSAPLPASRRSNTQLRAELRKYRLAQQGALLRPNYTHCSTANQNAPAHQLNWSPRRPVCAKELCIVSPDSAQHGKTQGWQKN